MRVCSKWIWCIAYCHSIHWKKLEGKSVREFKKKSLQWHTAWLSASQIHPFNQGKSSSTPVTSDLSKTFHQICLWLHQLVKTRKSTEDSVIYLLGNPQRDVGDWLTLINKLNTIATYSIKAATCQQQQTTPNHACPCVCACSPEVPPYRKKDKYMNKKFFFFLHHFSLFLFLFLYNGSNSNITIEREREREREVDRETERERRRGRRF